MKADNAGRLPALRASAAVLVLLFLAAGVHRLFVTNINWDEFYYLSLVHLFRAGDLANPLQTLHVRLYGWLPSVSPSEIEQVFAARATIWLVALATAWFIYRIARRFCTVLGALFALTLYLTFTYVVDHGLSFRADPICALLFLVAAHLLINKRERWYAAPLTALALAAAAMVSIKSVFYLPTVAVLLAVPLLGDGAERSSLRRAAIVVFATGVAFAALFLWHQLDLAPPSLTDAGAYAAAAGGKTLVLDDLVPARRYVWQALIDNTLAWVFILCGLWIAARRLFDGYARADSLMLLSLALPLLSLLIYRNAFPYFFVFLMPPAVIVAAVAADSLAERAWRRGGSLATATLAATLAMATAAYGVRHAGKLPDQTVAQAEIVELVHGLFSQPVPYIDRNSMIASFPKVGIFMSTWGLESYRTAGRPIMADLLAQHAPPLLLANHPALNVSQSLAEDGTYTLFPEDARILQENYLPHWGIVYLAGKRFALDASAHTFEILIPGTYTLEADGAVLLDDAKYEPGAALHLTRGAHRIAAPAGGAREVALRWGANLPKPARAPSPQPIYTGL